MKIFDPVLPLASPRPFVDGRAAIEARVRGVLETPVGTLPFRPTYGCDLTDFVGQPASQRVREQARARVLTALRRWVPEVEIVRCAAEIVPYEDGLPLDRPGLPIAETRLFSVGPQARLQIEVEILADLGPVSVSVEVGA